MKKWAALALALLLALPLSSCGRKETRYQAQFLTLFDTVTTIVGYSRSKEAFTQQAQVIHDELEIYHQLYDIYHGYEGIQNIKTINDQAGAAPVKVDRRIIDLLLVSKEMYGQTHGKVNIAFGSVLSLWHGYRSRGVDDPLHSQLPPMDELREAERHTDIEKLIIDEAASTVFLADPEMRLDVGAIAKGYAAQRVCDSARADGVSSLLVSVGGNVCAIGGMDEKGTPWKVGIQDPAAVNQQAYLLTVGLAGNSLVTSGSYQRYYTVDGKRYHHIIDPDTLMPAQYSVAVSVVSADSGIADALSTALFNMPFEDGLRLVEGIPGTGALWILPDGTQETSSAFKQFIIKQ